MGGVGTTGDRRGGGSHTPLWNPEWASHGRFFEKIKDRLGRAAGPRRRRRTLCGRRGSEQHDFSALDAARPSAGPVSRPLARQPHVRLPPPCSALLSCNALLHHHPVSTEPEKVWEHGNVMLGFDAEERLIQKSPEDFAAKVVWGSRYPHHDATSAWDAIARLRDANVSDALIARMMGQNAADQLCSGRP